MKPSATPEYWRLRLDHAERALTCLEDARDLLAAARATRAADATRRAIKSAQGAKRHAEGHLSRSLGATYG